jgi:teichuronic acid biosynthesis glycosyltransferase TuaC
LNSDSRHSILFVGNLVDVKAPERAIGAFAKLVKRHPALHLDIIGDGPLRPKLVRHVASSNLVDQVTFHGRQPPQIVADIMRQANCLLLTSRSEGMPNVVIESLACGTPVVATDVGEVPFLVQNDLNGYVVQRKNAEDESALIANIARAVEKSYTKTWDFRSIAASVKDFTWRAAARVIEENIVMPEST